MKMHMGDEAGMKQGMAKMAGKMPKMPKAMAKASNTMMKGMKSKGR